MTFDQALELYKQGVPIKLNHWGDGAYLQKGNAKSMFINSEDLESSNWQLADKQKIAEYEAKELADELKYRRLKKRWNIAICVLFIIYFLIGLVVAFR